MTIANATEYPARVEVTGTDLGGWFALRSLPPNSEADVEQVIDQGDLWVFRFHYAGRYSEEMEVSRAELERNGWRVEVPQTFEEGVRRIVDPSSG